MSLCLQPEQWKQASTTQAERTLGIRAIPRTLSVGESGRSSATLGTSSVEEWLQWAARGSDNDGDSPASRLQYQLMQGEVPNLIQPARHMYTVSLARSVVSPLIMRLHRQTSSTAHTKQTYSALH